jgi:hypothetical protein
LNITSTRLTSASGVFAGVPRAKYGWQAIAPPAASTLFMKFLRCIIATPPAPSHRMRRLILSQEQNPKTENNTRNALRAARRNGQKS